MSAWRLGCIRFLAFDLETTGTNPEKDRIVEACFLEPGGTPVVFRVNPGVPIPPDASAVHGITDADVADAPPFADVAPKVQAIAQDAVLVGYNSRTFDTPLLDAELRRAGQPGLRLDDVREIDVLRVWQAVEPRTLTGAARRWLGASHDDAHAAHADVLVTMRVLEAIRAHAGLDERACMRLSHPENEVDRGGKFVVDDDGHVVFNFGKHQGVRASAVDAGYLKWMSGAEFPSSTKAVVARLIEHGGDLPELAARRAALARAKQA